MLTPSECSLLLFTSLNNRARPRRLFRNPNRSLLSRSTAIRATEFLSPKSIPTKMCLTCIEASLLSKGLALFYSEPVPRLAFFYIVNSSRGGDYACFVSAPYRSHWQGVKRQPEDRIDRNQENAFHPVRLPIGCDEVDDNNGQSNGCNLERRKEEIERPSESVAYKDKNRSHEQRDLQARTDGNIYSEVDFVLQCNKNGGAVLSRVPDDRYDKNADEDVRHAESFGCVLDCSN